MRRVLRLYLMLLFLAFTGVAQAGDKSVNA
jgi:hypothetical protein